MSKPDYGNWIPKRLIYVSFAVGLVFLVSAFGFLFFLVIPAALLFFVAAFFAYARYMFSSAGGNVQNFLGLGSVTFGLDW